MNRPTQGALLALLLLGFPLSAQERSGPLVLRLPTSAWALGMGNAGVAARWTSDVLFHNPSSLTLASGAALGVQRWGGASTAASLSHAVITNGWGIGVGVQYLDLGATGGSITHPAELGSRGPLLASSLAGTLGLSREVKGWRVGVAAKYAEERRPGDRDGAVLVDVGVGRDVGIFGFGAALTSFGRSQVFDGLAMIPPTRATVGALLRPRPIGTFFDAAATTEVALTQEGRAEVAGGGELIWVPLEGWAIAARLGFRSPERVGELGGRPYTAGLGISLDQFSLDYAIDPQRGGGVAHRVGIRMR